ncbi:hypothetical protein, partial [Klebsiella aerogenes]|uniref:hypothetical protein n=1 Tax=Klebsiella aerogenes TaxID=548 RepID=UPI001CC5CB8E
WLLGVMDYLEGKSNSAFTNLNKAASMFAVKGADIGANHRALERDMADLSLRLFKLKVASAKKNEQKNVEDASNSVTKAAN